MTSIVALYLLQIISELPSGSNWNFDVHWYPKIPGIISVSSFDGRIGIYNVEVLLFMCPVFNSILLADFRLYRFF